MSISTNRELHLIGCKVLLLVLLSAYALGVRAELSLADAERLALEADPAVIASQSRALALQEQAIADGQLPDPKLTVGVWNVPLDDFSMKKRRLIAVSQRHQAGFSAWPDAALPAEAHRMAG